MKSERGATAHKRIVVDQRHQIPKVVATILFWAQKYTTFFGLTEVLLDALATPALARSAVASSRSSPPISRFLRLIMWKSSSSAPTSRPVPRKEEVALPSVSYTLVRRNTCFAKLPKVKKSS